jgi:Icc-related predicted phosphoesterase
MAKTRIFFATDLHGSEKCFRKFVSAGNFYDANVLIVGGDITGKMIIPIVRQRDGSFIAELFGVKRLAKQEKELLALEDDIRNSGFYPYRTDPDEMKLLTDETKIDEVFSRLMVQTLERWVELAEEHLKNTGIKCFVMPGNDDRLVVDPVIEKSDFVVNPEGKSVWVDEHHEMISTGYANITPFDCPRDIPEEELAKKIEAMACQVKDMNNCIFNFHCPPYDTQLDSAPKLDGNLKPVVSGGNVVMCPAGSTSVRSAIEKYQPLLGLHGHIHESRGIFRIRRTVCLNPGSEYTEGYLRGAIVNLNRDKVESYTLTSG